MVSAILRLIEQDGEILPPRQVTIVGPCPHHRGGGCIEVATDHGEPMYVSPEELEAEETPHA